MPSVLFPDPLVPLLIIIVVTPVDFGRWIPAVRIGSGVMDHEPDGE